MRMNRLSPLWKIIVSLLLISLNAGFAAARDEAKPADKKASEEDPMQMTLRVPVGSPLFAEMPVALVNGEPITLGELKSTLVFAHAQDLDETSKAPEVDFKTFLDRLITVQLFVQEARNIGVDELPEIKASIKRFTEATMRQMYVAEYIKNIKADPAETEKLYRDSVREWKIQSAVFVKEESARKMAAAVKSGTPFEEAAAAAIAGDKNARLSGKAEWVPARALSPQVNETLSSMKPGSVSPVIKTGAAKLLRFSFIRLEDVRFPDNAEEREKAEKKAENSAKQKALDTYKKELYKKHVKMNAKLLSGIDYEAKKPGIEQLARDKRVVAELYGKKITVGELTTALQQAFYHGTDVAAQSKKLNNQKKVALEDLIDKILLEREAVKQGTDKTPEFRSVVREFETNLLFGNFIDRVVKQEVKVTADEKKAYYKEHQKNFTPPPSLKLSSLVFATEQDAKAALEKLKKRTDFNWMRENAEGQVKDAETWNGDVLVVEDLDAQIREAVTGAQKGDFRLAKSGEGQYHVISVLDIVPAQVRPFEEVDSIIEKILTGISLDKKVKEWGDRLRKASTVKIYIAGTGK
jgi:parvulin-like peptidyl-prolyl isomerase